VSDSKPVERIVLWELRDGGVALSCGGFGVPTEFGYIYTRENRTGRTRRFPAGAKLILEVPAGLAPKYEPPKEARSDE
jgi:hypothetical protein